VKDLLAAEAPSTRVIVGESIVVAETPFLTVTVADHVTVETTHSTSVVRATPAITVREASPIATEDEPSDGIVRSMIATPVAARRRDPSAPPESGPPIRETTGEISRAPKQSPATDHAVEPSILVGDVESTAASDPLVADLAAAHSAIAAVVARASAAPPTADAASPSRELAVAEVRRDAVEFSATEEAFFKSADRTEPHSKVRPESFDDLDEDYEKPKFWDRVFGRKPPAR